MGTFSVSVTGCLPCCGAAAVSFECRTQGDFAGLCGYDENIGFESTPPKRYKTKTLSGGWVYDSYTSGTCSVLACTETAVFSNACVVDPAVTCFIPVSSANVVFTGCSPLGKATCGITADRTPCGDFTTTTNAVAIAITVNSNVCTSACKAVSANALEMMTNEDTEADAIARVIADFPWGSWSNVTTCQSRYQNRGTGYGFEYIEAQFRYSATGLAPSTNYTLTFDVYERPYNTGGFSFSGTISSGFTTDGAGAQTITGDVPITFGLDTYVTNPVVA